MVRPVLIVVIYKCIVFANFMNKVWVRKKKKCIAKTISRIN